MSATAHLPEGVKSNTTFDLAVQLHAPLPVSEVVSHTHKLETQGLGSDRVTLALADEGMRDNRDFILEYRLGGERTATGLMLYRAPDATPDAENFFLALVEPPQQVAPVQINPRDYIFVVDISGSMNGHPLATAKVLLRIEDASSGHDVTGWGPCDGRAKPKSAGKAGNSARAPDRQSTSVHGPQTI